MIKFDTFYLLSGNSCIFIVSDFFTFQILNVCSSFSHRYLYRAKLRTNTYFLMESYFVFCHARHGDWYFRFVSCQLHLFIPIWKHYFCILIWIKCFFASSSLTSLSDILNKTTSHCFIGLCYFHTLNYANRTKTLYNSWLRFFLITLNITSFIL